MGDADLLALFAFLAGGDRVSARRSLAKTPALATEALSMGATRRSHDGFFFDAIGHGVVSGDTALHVAAAAHEHVVVEELLARGAKVSAKNR